MLKVLTRTDGETLVYHHMPGNTPGVLFCAGFRSDMQGGKALALEALCKQRGQQFTRFDYFGHGQSSGAMADGSIGRWREDTLAILDEITDGPQLVVGSSMGGWMMLLAAELRPKRIVALVGVAVAPDMTADLLQNRLSLTDIESLNIHGWCDLEPQDEDDRPPYRIHQWMLDEAKPHLLLGRAIAIDVPVRLAHGFCDEVVPWQRSLQVMQLLQGENVELELIKEGDHRLSSSVDLQRLCSTVAGLLDQLGGHPLV